MYHPTPLVSIIVTVYNKECYIADTLKSALTQTYPHIEVIVVNDGSTDNSQEIINKIVNSDNRVIIIEQDNSGPASARNSGIKIAKGEYINFLDGDDLLYPTFVEETLKFLIENPKIDIVHTSWDLLDNAGNKITTNIASKSDDYLRDLLIDNLFAIHALMLRRKIIDKAGLMLDIKTEDWEYWTRCAKQGAKFKNFNKVLVATLRVPGSDHQIIVDQDKRFSQAIEYIFDDGLEKKYKKLKSVSILRQHLYQLEDFINWKIKDDVIFQKINHILNLLDKNKIMNTEIRYLIGNLRRLPLLMSLKIIYNVVFNIKYLSQSRRVYYLFYLFQTVLMHKIKIIIKGFCVVFEK